MQNGPSFFCSTAVTFSALPYMAPVGSGSRRMLPCVPVSKFKPYRGPKKKEQSRANAIPCLVLIGLGLILIFVLFYSMLRAS